jgi:hypothetical protein
VASRSFARAVKPDEFLREVIPLLTGAGITYMVVGSFAAPFTESLERRTISTS